MKAISRIFLALSLLFAGAIAAPAQSDNAARLAVASVHQINRVLPEGRWVTLLATDIKKPGNKDLFLHTSLECGVFSGTSDQAFADVALYVQVTVDGKATAPGRVVFCGKTNEMIPRYAKLASCTDNNGGHSQALDRCSFTTTERAEIDRSLRAHTFNYLHLDLAKGIHHVAVQAFLDRASTESESRAVVGAGALEVTVENLKNK